MTTQPSTEERLSRIEGSHERIGDLVQQFEGFRTETNTRFESLRSETNARFRDLSAQFESLRAGMDRRFEEARAETNREFGSMRAEMNSAIRNLYVIIGGSWVTLMATIIGLNLAA